MTGKSQKTRDTAPVYNPTPAQANAAIPPTSEFTTINGRLVSDRQFSPASNSYYSNIYLDPIEQNILNTGKQHFSDLLNRVPQTLATTDAERKSFADALYNPQRDNLLREYNTTLGEAVNSANSAGTLNSIGFENYRAKQLDKNLLDGLSQLRNQAEIQSYSLPNLKLDPVIRALSIYDTSINSPTERGLELLDPSFQGSQASNNFALQRFQVLANQPARKSSRSFLSSFF